MKGVSAVPCSIMYHEVPIRRMAVPNHSLLRLIRKYHDEVVQEIMLIEVIFMA